jgi:serine/threonine-protein kinase
LPGALVAGKYMVERLLAEGGIGVVVVARQLDLQRLVAIKHLRPRALANATLVERFQREARLAARLRSEHVVRVHDVGALPDVGPYMVMEYLEGSDLSRIARERTTPIAGVVDWMLQACEAIAEAHALGIVHRDLKPDNLFVARLAGGASLLKVLDFGISKLMPGAEHLDASSRPTEMGERFGTPVYMSPEQLRSAADVDPRTDLWSLGVVLFELLAGELPFAGESMAQLCTSILTARPKALRAIRPEVPPGLAKVVERCLQKDPARRYASVAELAIDLTPYGSGATVVTRRPARRTRRAVVLAGAVLATAAAAVTLALATRRAPEATVPDPVPEATALAPRQAVLPPVADPAPPPVERSASPAQSTVRPAPVPSLPSPPADDYGAFGDRK